jgi:outer membrane protein
MKGYKQALTVGLGLAMSMIMQSSHGAGLMEIYDLAVGNDPQFKAAQANLEAAREALPQSTANFLPSLDANASHSQSSNSGKSRVLNPVTSTYGYYPYSTDSSNNNYSLSLTQPIYHHESYVQRATAKSAVAQAEAVFKSAQEGLVLDVANAYLGVLAAKDNLDFAIAEKQSNARQLDQTKQRFDVGLVAVTDVNESQAAYDISVAQQIAAQNELDNAKEALREITGSYPDKLEVVNDDIPLLPPDPDNLEDWIKKAMDQNTELLAATQATEQARENVSAQKSGYYPTLDLNVSKYKSDTTISSTTTNSDSTTATLQLNMNLFAGGGTKSRVYQARQYLRASEQNLEQVRRKIQRQIRNAYHGITSGISRVKALKQAVISSQSALRAAEAGYEVGTRTTVDVLAARSNLFLAERNYAQSRYSYIVDRLTLNQVAGSLDAANLKEITKWMH